MNLRKDHYHAFPLGLFLSSITLGGWDISLWMLSVCELLCVLVVCFFLKEMNNQARYWYDVCLEWLVLLLLDLFSMD